MVWLCDQDIDKSDEQPESDVSEREYLGKEYLGIFAEADFGECSADVTCR
jgi:hypothetical protein